jgi:hypothetical protein
VHLDAALALARDPPLRVQRFGPREVLAEAIAAADLVILDGAIPVGDDVRRALVAHVAGGAGVLAIAGAGPFPRIDPLLPVVGGTVDAGPRGGAFTELASGHPLAGALGVGRLVGVGVWRYRRLDPMPGDRVLARYDSGDAALVERGYGTGRTLTLGTALDPQWGALAVDPVFVPLLMESLWYLAGRGSVASSQLPGTALDPLAHAGAVAGGETLAAALSAGDELRVRAPGGGDRPQPATRPLVLAQPGFHELRAGDAPALPVAVSVDARESRLDAMSEEAFLARLRRTPSAPTTGARRLARVPPDERLAHAVLALAAVLLLAEGALAAGIGRRRRRQERAA